MYVLTKEGKNTEDAPAPMYELISVTRSELNITASFYDTKEEAFQAMLDDIYEMTSHKNIDEIKKAEKAGLCGFSGDDAWAETTDNDTCQWQIVEIPAAGQGHRRKTSTDKGTV